MLKETYVAVVTTKYEKDIDTIIIFVALNDPWYLKKSFDTIFKYWFQELAPSEELLNDYHESLKKYGSKNYKKNLEGRKKAFEEVNYKKRFYKEMKEPKANEKMKEIKEMAKEKDVYLVCYEKEYPCHRFLLMDMINGL